LYVYDPMSQISFSLFFFEGICWVLTIEMGRGNLNKQIFENVFDV